MKMCICVKRVKHSEMTLEVIGWKGNELLLDEKSQNQVAMETMTDL